MEPWYSHADWILATNQVLQEEALFLFKFDKTPGSMNCRRVPVRGHALPPCMAHLVR